MRHLLAIGIVFFSCLSAMAASTEWQDIGGGKARMIAILSPETGLITGGVQIELNAGWKTYWRAPGDSGIPPQFDFSKSVGFAHGETHLPAPVHIIGTQASYVGYKENVTFVFTGQPLASTGRLQLNLFLGVCEEICIPAQARFELALADLYQSDPQTLAHLQQAKTRLPAPPSENFAITSLARSDSSTLRVEVRVPGDPTDTHLFAEGLPNWFLEPAKRTDHKGDRVSFLLDLSSLPADADLENTELRFTVVTGDTSIEQWRSIK